MTSDRPSANWVYRDEDFGGAMARLGRSRGGLKSAPATGETVLNRFRLQFEVPAI